MAEFDYPPLDGPDPVPISPTVPLNPPMVGEASPFDEVDGQNRDLILQSIRVWSRTSLRNWTAAWQARLTALIAWLNGWVVAADQYITFNAVPGHSWWSTVTPLNNAGTTTVIIVGAVAPRTLLVGDFVVDTSVNDRYGIITTVIDATHAVVQTLGSLQGIPGPNTIPTNQVIAANVGLTTAMYPRLVGETDDTLSFQRMLDDAAALASVYNPMTCTIMPGSYVIKQVLIRDFVTLQGSGGGNARFGRYSGSPNFKYAAVTIQHNPSTAAATGTAKIPMFVVNGAGAVLKDFTITGNFNLTSTWLNPSSGDQAPAIAISGYGTEITNVHCIAYTHAFIWVDLDCDPRMSYLQWDNCGGLDVGYYGSPTVIAPLVHGTNAASNWFVNAATYFTGLTQLLASTASNTALFDHLVGQGSYDKVWDFGGVNGLSQVIRVTNSHFEDARPGTPRIARTAPYPVGNVQDMRISGCFFYGGTYGVPAIEHKSITGGAGWMKHGLSLINNAFLGGREQQSLVQLQAADAALPGGISATLNPNGILPPETLVHLVNGDGAVIEGNRFDSCYGQFVYIESTYGINAFVNPDNSYAGSNPVGWSANTAFQINSVIAVSSGILRAQNTGSTDPATPVTLPTAVGGTVVDGTITWIRVEVGKLRTDMRASDLQVPQTAGLDFQNYPIGADVTLTSAGVNVFSLVSRNFSRVGICVITANMDTQYVTANDVLSFTLNIDGNAQTGIIAYQQSASIGRVMLTKQWTVTIPVGAHTIQVLGKVNSGTGTTHLVHSGSNLEISYKV